MLDLNYNIPMSGYLANFTFDSVTLVQSSTADIGSIDLEEPARMILPTVMHIRLFSCLFISMTETTCLIFCCVIQDLSSGKAHHCSMAHLWIIALPTFWPVHVIRVGNKHQSVFIRFNAIFNCFFFPCLKSVNSSFFDFFPASLSQVSKVDQFTVGMFSMELSNNSFFNNNVFIKNHPTKLHI